jgi:methylglutaconyl-CoA hydratase
MTYTFISVDSGLVEGETRPGIQIITINRAEVHNAFNDQLISELRDVAMALARDPGLRVVVLRGAGRSFSAGADLQSMKEAKSFSVDENRLQAEALSDMFEALNSLPCPLVGVVQGAALGGGSGLAAVCDFVIAGPRARFGFSEVRLGIVPAVISPYVISKIGESGARAYFLTGKQFDGDEALRLGLVHRVVKDEEGLPLALSEVVDDILRCGPSANALAKRLIRRVVAFSAEGGLTDSSKGLREYTSQVIAEARVADEGQEGLIAFLEKRDPRWVSE